MCCFAVPDLRWQSRQASGLVMWSVLRCCPWAMPISTILQLQRTNWVWYMLRALQVWGSCQIKLIQEWWLDCVMKLATCSGDRWRIWQYLMLNTFWSEEFWFICLVFFWRVLTIVLDSPQSLVVCGAAWHPGFHQGLLERKVEAVYTHWLTVDRRTWKCRCHWSICCELEVDFLGLLQATRLLEVHEFPAQLWQCYMALSCVFDRCSNDSDKLAGDAMPTDASQGAKEGR